MRMRKANNTPRSRRGNPFQIMGICRNQVWLGIFSLLAIIWSLLLFLNYSSLILSIRSLASFYVYSANQQNPIPLGTTSSIPADIVKNEDSSPLSSLDDDFNNVVDPLKGYQKEEKLLNITLISANSTNQPLNVAESDDHVRVDDNEITINAMPPPTPPPPPPRKRRPMRRGKRRGKGRSTTKPAAAVTQLEVEESINETSITPPPPSPPPPPCAGRYVYVHILPRRYHVDLLRDCSSLDLWMDMCQYVKNSGLGPPLLPEESSTDSAGWFATNQFLLEVIFHNRMKRYECLTNDSAQATAVFVPFYAGLDVARHLWNSNPAVRDSSALELVKWLKRKPEWKRFSGRDHFFVGGRITWDFRRSEDRKDPDWGTKLLYLPEARNITALVIESSPWNSNDFGIPYPTYFHPCQDGQVLSWQARMRARSRSFLFSFAGAPRPDRPDSIRNRLITQCGQSRRCNMVECTNWKNRCHNPTELMKVFQDSHFCLQPPGDSYTRRSTFDSIIAGCIPVFFHPGSAYAQYYWHLPRDYTKYSVFISMYEVRAGNVSVEGVLEKIGAKKAAQMREEVIKLIPRVVYADPRCKLETIKDAFDVAVEGVLERVRRRVKEEDITRAAAYDETQAWKYEWLGRLQEHEWDPYFSGRLDYHQNGN